MQRLLETTLGTEPTSKSLKWRGLHAAVSMRFLKAFAAGVPRGFSTHDVVHEIIKPATVSLHCRYVALLDEAEVGPAFAFASHTWRINAPAGNVELHLKASMIDAGDNEAFEFDVSLNGGATWLAPSLTVTPGTSGASYQIAPVTTAFGGGEIRVRVRDTDQTPGNRGLEELLVDHLFLRVL